LIKAAARSILNESQLDKPGTATEVVEYKIDIGFSYSDSHMNRQSLGGGTPQTSRTLKPPYRSRIVFWSRSMATSSTRRKPVKRGAKKDPTQAEILSVAEYLAAQAGEFPTKGERTRCRFKAATAKILGQKGYHDLRMADICDEVGLSHGAIYEYYSNKKEITVEVLDDMWNHAMRIMRADQSTVDEFSRLYGANLVWVKMFGQNAGLQRCMRQVSDDIDEFRQQYLDLNTDWYDRIARHILKVVGDPPGAGVASKVLARSLGCMADELLHDVYIRRVPGLEDLADSPELLAKVISIMWYRMAYVANPPVDLKGKYGKILDIALDGGRKD
jgi:AcrR family transcriptional regulator